MSKNLVIVVSDTEYEKIHTEATKKGISASKYAYDLIFSNENNFESKWNSLLTKIKTFPTNTEFDISLLVGTDTWKTYDKSTKLSLARTLSRKINDGTLNDIIVIGRSSSNVTIYKKIE